MILDLLNAFSVNPDALLSTTQLALLLRDQFEAVVDSGIVVPTERSATHVLREGRVLRVDELPDGTLEGSDDFDLDYAPIPLCADDVDEWTLDSQRLALTIANAQGLSGSPQILSRRFALAANVRRDLPMVVGLLNQDATSTNRILAMRSRLPRRTRGIIVVSAAFVPEALDEVVLEHHGVVVAKLQSDFSLRPSMAACAQSLTQDVPLGTLEPESGFLLASDCRSATLGSRQFLFSAMQGAAVSVMLNAYLRGQPLLHQEAILSEIESSSTQLKSVFKRNPAFESLIKGDDLGRFKLDFAFE